MVALGNHCGVNTRALLTNMDAPVGRAAGNWLEVKEAVACLECQTLAHLNDLRELVLDCASHLLVQSGKSSSLDVARQRAQDCLASGAPRKKWDEMLAAQGADLEAFRRKLSLDHTAPVVTDAVSKQSGFVSKCDARLIGEVVRDLGGGRLMKESAINYDVGVDRIKKIGEQVSPGEALARIHAADANQANSAAARVLSAFKFTPSPPITGPLLQEILTNSNQ
jgi:thymidine phosphorylase